MWDVEQDFSVRSDTTAAINRIRGCWATRVRQNARMQEMHASADNSRLRAYVGDLMVVAIRPNRGDVGSGGRMVICGFGLVKHSGATAQIRPCSLKSGRNVFCDRPPDWTRTPTEMLLGALSFVIYEIECNVNGTKPRFILDTFTQNR